MTTDRLSASPVFYTTMTTAACIGAVCLASMLVLCVTVRSVEFRTPYYEMDGGFWIDLRHGKVTGLDTVGIRRRSNQFGGKWSLQVDRHRGQVVPLCAPGCDFGTSKLDGYPRMWWARIAGNWSS